MAQLACCISFARKVYHDVDVFSDQGFGQGHDRELMQEAAEAAGLKEWYDITALLENLSTSSSLPALSLRRSRWRLLPAES